VEIADLKGVFRCQICFKKQGDSGRSIPPTAVLESTVPSGLGYVDKSMASPVFLIQPDKRLHSVPQAPNRLSSRHLPALHLPTGSMLDCGSGGIPVRQRALALVVLGVLVVAFSSWLAIAEGAESPKMRFYPDKTEIKPGETVTWTIEVLDESILPLTAHPEFNNDIHREPLISLEEAVLRIEFKYDEANIYVPYLETQDSSGHEQKVYSESLVVVLPDLAQRTGVGLSLAPVSGGNSDFIKAIRATNCDSSLLETAAGLQDIHRQLASIAELGTNLVVFNLEWFFDDPSASIHEPLYGRIWPVGRFGTIPLGALTKLVDWAHDLGMRVGLSYFLTEKQGYLPGSRGRYAYEPADEDLYMDWQTSIHVTYAEICERLGVELFILDAENDFFTQNPRVADLIREVREVFSGAITEQAYTVDRVWSCPYVDQLDFVAWSDYYFGFADLADRGLGVEVLESAFARHYEADVLPVLEHVGKPAMFLELGSNFREIGDEQGQSEYQAYLDVIARVTADSSPVIGLCWWEWALLEEDPSYPHDLRGHSAEQTVADYFIDILPDQVTYARAAVSPANCFGLKPLASFEPTENLTLHAYERGGRLSYSYDSTTGHPDSSLHMAFMPSTAERQVVAAGAYVVPDEPEDWTEYQTLCFWLLSDAENCNCVSSLQFEVIDNDGDRFTFGTSARTFLSGWQLVEIDLDLLSCPSWIPSSAPGDRNLDLGQVAKWGFLFTWDDGRIHNVWIDSVHLGRSTDRGSDALLQQQDTDSDGVPDDEDYCPDWPGSPETNGC